MPGSPRLERTPRTEATPSTNPPGKTEPPEANRVTLRPLWAWMIFALVMLGIPTLALLRTCAGP